MLDFTKPVQTRKRLPTRVLCTDRAGEWAVVALVGEKETVMLYTNLKTAALALPATENASTEPVSTVPLPSGFLTELRLLLGDSDKAAQVHRLITSWFDTSAPVSQPAPAKLPELSEAERRKAWSDAANWLRNNYQDHPNIASLCDAMREEGSKGQR